MTSEVMSLRFAPQQMERLQRVARRLGGTPNETGALLVEESLRRSEFALIDFRDSPAGRQAYIRGLAVWEVVLVARSYDMDAEKTAKYLGSIPRVQAAFNYAEAFPEKIDAAIADNASFDFERLRRLVPRLAVSVSRHSSQTCFASYWTSTFHRSSPEN